MECKRVKIVGGRFIDCNDIVPNKSAPGFFDLWIGNGKRRIVNGRAIVEVVEKEEDPQYHDLPVIL